MALQNPARLTAIEGRDTVQFETSAIVRFPELIPHADEAAVLCKAATMLLGDKKNVAIKFLGSVSFGEVVAEHVRDTPVAVMDSDNSTGSDCILIQLGEAGHMSELPAVVNMLGTLSTAVVEANRIATYIR